MTAKLVPVGNGFILMSSEEFATGYQAGHLAYMSERPSAPHTDEQLTELFMERLEDVALSTPYSMGFVVGWLATLSTKGLSPIAPIRLSTATLGQPTKERG